MMVYEFVAVAADDFVLLNEWMQTVKVCDVYEVE
jgi:hypothetical protein